MIKRKHAFLLAVSTVALSTLAQASQLLLTEVYFEGRDEWIEITNLGTGNFSGFVSLPVFNLSPTYLSLTGGESVVIGNYVSHLLDLSSVEASGEYRVFIPETTGRDFALEVSGVVLDSGVVPWSLISQWDNSKRSLSRQQSGQAWTFVGTEESYNTYAGYTATPGWFDPNGTVPASGLRDRTQGLPQYPLVITELMYRGASREWLEITNVSEALFESEVTIVGAGDKQQTLELSLAPGEVLIIADNSENYISGAQNKLVLQDFNVLDGSPTISLLIDQEVVDVFWFDTLLLDQSQSKTSFVRQRDEGRYTNLANILYNTGMISGSSYTANPGVVYSRTGLQMYPKIAPLIPDLPEYCSQGIVISEVHMAQDVVADYIELYTQGNLEGEILLTGSALWETVVLQVDTHTGQYFLISPTSYTIHDITLIEAPELQIVGPGEIQLVQSGVTIDTIFIPEVHSVEGHARYAPDLSCGRGFTEQDRRTPATHRDYAQLLPRITTIISGEYQTGDEISLSLSGALIHTGLEIEITTITFDPPGSDTNNEQITLLLQTGAQDLWLSGRDLLYDNKTFSFETGVLLWGQETTFTENFRFVNSRPVCVSLSYSGEVYDTLCYDPDQHSQSVTSATSTGEVTSTGTGTTTGSEIDYSQIQLEIQQLVYDPTVQGGTDESITLLLKNGPQSLDLDTCRLRVNQNKTTKKLTGIAVIHQPFTLSKNFAFPNTKASTITLFCSFDDQEYVYDTFQYTPEQEEKSTQQVAYDYTKLEFELEDIIYDPSVQEADSEAITIRFIDGADRVDLSDFKLRINDNKTTKTLQGTLQRGKSLTIEKNFAFPNTKASRVYLLYPDAAGDIVYDSISYDPKSGSSEPSSPKPEEKEAQEIVSEEQVIEREIRIRHILYDPPGADADQESITLELISGSLVDLESCRLRINGRNKKIYGILDTGGPKTFTGTFAFANTKATCVELIQGDHVFDEYCYDPNETPSGSGEIISTRIEEQEIPKIKISSVLPNPQGVDGAQERLGLLLLEPDAFVLTKEIGIRIGKRIIRLSGSLLAQEEKIFTGVFSLPNRDTCLDLLYADEIIDTFCYPKPKEGMIYTHTNQTIQYLGAETLAILQQVRFQNTDQQLCAMYGEYRVRCAKTKVPKDTSVELRLAKAYIARLEEVLRNDWKYIRYHSPLGAYAQLYRQAKTQLDQGTISIRGYEVSVFDLDAQYQLNYGKNIQDYLREGLTLFWLGSGGKQMRQDKKNIALEL